jgi:uncharacterized membrane protein YphA (DoxX/SURF4 family)
VGTKHELGTQYGQEVNIMPSTIARLESSRIALRISFGLLPLLAGLDKFTYLLTDWSQYVGPIAGSFLPVEPQTFLYAVGLVEIGVGLAVLTRWTVVGSYAAAGWLTLIAGNLVLAGFFDIAVRDVVLAVAAFTLARLTEAHELAEGHVEERRDERARLVA